MTNIAVDVCSQAVVAVIAVIEDLKLETFYISIVRRLTPSVIGSRRETATSHDGHGARFERIAAAILERIGGSSPLPARHSRLAQYE